MKSKKILAGILALTLMCAPAAADFSFANNFNISASAEDISDDATEMFWLGKESGITNGKIGVPNGYYDNNGNNISEKDEYGNNINSDLYDSNKTFKYRVHIDKLSDFGFVYTGMASALTLYDANGTALSPTKTDESVNDKTGEISTITAYKNLSAGDYYIAGTTDNDIKTNNYILVLVDEITAPKKRTISAASKIRGAYGRSAYVSAYTPGGNLQYKSSNSKIFTVDKYGKITYKKPGVAYLKITAPATKYYKYASKTVKVVVTPKNIARVKGKLVKHYPNAAVKVTWTRDKNASGYIVYVSSKKNSKGQLIKPKRIVIKNNKVNYYKVKGLNRTCRRYFKIASYKKVSKKLNIYGNKVGYGFRYRLTRR